MGVHCVVVYELDIVVLGESLKEKERERECVCVCVCFLSACALILRTPFDRRTKLALLSAPTIVSAASMHLHR